MEKFVLLCIFLVGTFLKLSNGQVTCNNKDADSSCGTWKQSGFCTHSHVEYMRKNCMKSCGTCANPNPAVTCNNKDGDRNCNIWTNLGFCEGVHEAYMEKNCMKSCKQCGVVAVNCAWGNWVAWSVCSVTCGSGFRTRTRAKSTSASNGGVKCPGLPLASEPCKLIACAGASVCGKLPAKQCTTGLVCSNPDTPCAKCEAPVCGKLPAKQCKTGEVCSNPDTPSAKCGAAVCGFLPVKKCTTNFETCINPDTPLAKCEFHCGATSNVCIAGSIIPSCLDVLGNTPTPDTRARATCQCTTTSCLRFNARSEQISNTPVCGTSTNGALLLNVGACGPCRMGKNGSRPGTTQNGAGTAGALAPIGVDSTCPASMGCCANGECVAKTCPLPAATGPATGNG